MTDREILSLLFARSEQAIEALRMRFDALCRRITMNILKSEADAEECVADTYLAVWNTVPPREPDPLKPYVGRIARNLALDRYRYNHAACRYAGGDALLDELEEIVSGAESAEDGAAADALRDTLNRFLASLKKDERRLFLRRYWYGDSVDALAADAGITPNGAAVKLHRIRGRLREFLISEGFTL